MGIEYDRFHMFMATCWFLWRARNQLCMKNESVSIYYLKLQIFKFVKTLLDAFSPQCKMVVVRETLVHLNLGV